MSYSKLVTYVKLSPNRSSREGNKIDTITIHCMAGNLSVESCGSIFANPARKASSNYGIGTDGRIACYVEDEYRSWCSSSRSNDRRAITIEVANTQARHPWPVSKAAYESLILLCADICKRHGIKKLLWRADKSLIGNVSKQNMTVHRWFAAKACPGDDLYNHMGDIAARANKILAGESPKEDEEEVTQEKFNEMMNMWLQTQGAKEPDSWSKEAREFCEDVGIITGDDKGAKKYKRFVTREESAIMIYRAITYCIESVRKMLSSSK